MSHPATAAVLHEVMLALAHEAPRESVFALVAEKALLLTEAQSAVVGLLTDDRGELVFEAVAGDGGDDLLGSRVRVEDTHLGATACTGEPRIAYHPDGPIRSVAAVAIHHDGHPIGAVAALNRRDDAPFGGDDLMALTTLAAAASARVAAARLRDGYVRHERELKVLYDAVRGISNHLSLHDVLRAVLEQIAAQIPAAAIALFLANDDHSHLFVAEETGLPDALRDMTLPADSGFARAVVMRSQPQRLAFTDDSPCPLPEIPARSGLATALRKGETVHGLILAVSQESDVYTEADANFLGALGAQAAAAIENALLYEDANRRAEEAATLYELSQAISSSLQMPEVLQRVADATLSLLAVDRFALFLRSPGEERLELAATRGMAPDAAERLQPAVGEGIPGWVVRFETPTAVQDVAADLRNASCPLQNDGVVSLLAMPLQAGGETIGVLCALTSRRRLFTVAEMELGYTVANHAAVAIHNARLYADARRKSLELRKYFHRVARALGAAESPSEATELVATLAREVTGADRAALHLEVDGRLEEVAASGFRSEAGGDDGEAPAAWVLRRGRSLAIEDIGADERFSGAAYPRPTRGRVAGYLAIPIRRDETVCGVLELCVRTPRRWRADEIRLLAAFAAQAAVALPRPVVPAGRD